MNKLKQLIKEEAIKRYGLKGKVAIFFMDIPFLGVLVGLILGFRIHYFRVYGENKVACRVRLFYKRLETFELELEELNK